MSKIKNFADFQKNDDVFMQKNHAFKKYQLQEKLIFSQLVENFADFRQNNSVLVGGKN